MRLIAAALIGLVLAGCSTQPPAGYEAVSLLGKPLPPPPPHVDAARREQQERDYAAAKAAYETNPQSEEAVIWYGRRTAYLGRFREAIDIFTTGLHDHPESAALLRHRGHRYITTRQLDNAVADLARAWELVRGKPDQVEADGVPNERNTPVSSLQSNISYHLGLAYYLQGRYERALAVYRDRMEVSHVNDDRLVSTTYWMYLSLKHLKRDAEAAAVLDGIRPGLMIVENQTYHKLLLLFRGEAAPADILDTSGDGPIENGTAAYGIGCWHWFRGERDEARRVWERIVASDNWPAFGYIAAEAELSRHRR